MRYPGSDKLEIIGLVEQSHLPVRRTLAALGILPVTCYRWYACLQAGGPEAQEDKPSRPRRVLTGSQKEVRSRSPNWHWTSRICRGGKCPKPQRAALKAIPGNPDKRRVPKFEPQGMASSLRLLVWTKRSERSGFTRYKIVAGPAAGTDREVLATWVGACVEHALAAAEDRRTGQVDKTNDCNAINKLFWASSIDRRSSWSAQQANQLHNLGAGLARHDRGKRARRPALDRRGKSVDEFR